MFSVQSAVKYTYTFGILVGLETCQGYPYALSHFHNTRCPPFFNSTDCSHKILQSGWFNRHFTSSDLELEKQSIDVEGLDSILKVFEKSHFLVILTDFRDVTFTALNYPVIIRRMRLAWEWSWYSYLNHGPPSNLIYAQSEILKRKISMSDYFGYRNPVGVSPFLQRIPRESFQNFLNISAYGMSTRPWNNLVSIALLPHIRFQQLFSEKSFLMDFVVPIKTKYNILPSLVSPINIFVGHPSDTHDMEHFTSLISYLTSPDIMSGLELYQQISLKTFYFVSTTSILSGTNQYAIRLTNLSLVKLCRRNFEPYLKFLRNRWDSLILSDLAESSMVCHETPNLNNLLVSFSFLDNQNMHLISQVHKSLQICQKESTPDELSDVRRVATGYASVWLSILGNFSYYIDADKQIYDSCKVFKIKSRKMFDVQIEIKPTFIQPKNTPSLYPAIISSVYNDLRLIICGYHRLEQLPFMELLITFDKYLWLALIICIFTLATVLKHFQGLPPNFSTVSGIVIQIKILLEQGNPFPHFMISNHQCKCITGTTLMMGIILSNAYKNTNVYNMVVPRKPVSYRYLQELVHANFNIYTRSRDVYDMDNLQCWIGKNGTPNTFGIKKADPHFREYNVNINKYFGVTINSSITHLSEVYRLHKEFKWTVILSTDKSTANLLFTASSLLRLTTAFLRDVINRTELTSSTEPDKLKYSSNFLKAELDYLKTHLRECKRTALLLPSHMGYELVQSSETEGQETFYQGMEAFYELNIAFEMTGFAPQYIIQRLKCTERCGLWNRWNVLFKKRLLRKNERKSEPLRRPTMNGNIVVIFIILISGLAVSAVCFGAESSMICIHLSGLRISNQFLCLHENF